jgi:predicted MPP superfamily phosphohydrolase
VDDPAVQGNLEYDGKQETQILATMTSTLFTVLLKHQPVIERDSLAYFDLQLSGHTHGGQIFPFGLFTKLIYPVGFGLTSHNNSWVYVSRGTGTWGPPMRIFAGAEITLFELLPGP